MPLPSLATRVSELQTELDRLLQWGSHLPTGSRWVGQLNELRFVRATLAWEEFLEQTFLCYLRGCRSVIGRSYALSVSAATNLASAQAAAIGTAPFGKWLNERWTLNRATAVFTGVHPYTALASPVFPEIRGIRNRIVHRSRNVRIEFQRIVVSLYGSTRPGMTPGRLLSDSVLGIPRIDSYLNLLKTVASIVSN